MELDRCDIWRGPFTPRLLSRHDLFHATTCLSSGFVVSDCDAINGIEGHVKGISHEAAAALAMNGGVDLDCGPFYQNFLAPAVESGKGPANSHGF